MGGVGDKGILIGEGEGGEYEESIGGSRVSYCQVSVRIPKPKAAAACTHNSPGGTAMTITHHLQTLQLPPVILLGFTVKLPFPSRWLAWLLARDSITPVSVSV